MIALVKFGTEEFENVYRKETVNVFKLATVYRVNKSQYSIGRFQRSLHVEES